MIEPGDNPRFPLKSGGERLVVKKFWWQHFERDRTIEPRVVGLVYRRHPALAQKSHDRERSHAGPRSKGGDVWFVRRPVVVSNGPGEETGGA
jgi:hypothetical protein